MITARLGASLHDHGEVEGQACMITARLGAGVHDHGEVEGQACMITGRLGWAKGASR